jgi:hypothetical protein
VNEIKRTQLTEEHLKLLLHDLFFLYFGEDGVEPWPLVGVDRKTFFRGAELTFKHFFSKTQNANKC